MYIALTLWLLTVGTAIYALLDGKINPVVSRLEISDIQSTNTDGDEWYRVIGTFEKHRNCQIEDIRWFYGNRRDTSRIAQIPVPTLIGQDTDYGSFPSSLPVGENLVSTYLRVRLDPELIEENSYAYVYHRCYGPWLWKTRTLFYDSELADQDRKDTDS